ncbi:potassium transporter [Burkholderia multivorans]|uniref:cation:proton antiporter n=1 Tax=Burkholderia multivorans TaxID=87883 RepID=UPI0007524F41|nr:cation:proton antiporter [Burkholderia multivorans]KWF73737.1 potassium transporter [Burkholderia multivorans]KWF73807.1 potassium transporter [Burkholderia multivorans]
MWLLQLATIVAASRLCGYLAQRIGQARVVGEITAGIILGPSVFGTLTPEFYETLFASHAKGNTSLLGEVGLVLLMFEVGLHLRMSAGWRTAVRLPGVVGLTGLILPLALGTTVALVTRPILAPGYAPLPYALFCGVALGVSAVPVMARIVDDLGLQHYPAAGTALTAAMLTDIAGWLLLMVVAIIARPHVGGALDLATSLLAIGAYVVICVVAVQRIVEPMLRGAAERSDEQTEFTILTCTIMLSSWATSELGFHSAFGALLPGMLLRDFPAIRERWSTTFGGFIRIVLMPVFFSFAGLHTSISSIGTDLWIWFGMFVAVGFAGKFGGAYLAARICSVPASDAFLIGSLMNARGLMELIVLSVGLQLGVLPTRVYSILVLFALATTAITTPLVRYWMRPSNQPLANSKI